MSRITWTGFGIVALPIWLAFLFGGCLLGGALTEDRLGGYFAFAVVGLLVGAAVNYAVGAALNRRRTPGGGWRWTGRHRLEDWPVERVSLAYLVLAVILAPCATADYVPKWLTYVLWFSIVPVAGFLAVRAMFRRQRAQRGA
jgi:membrane protein YqaA with SNARE-associated domain